ncbi:DUF6684 family protein [Halocatena pleomorpha]|uniref:Cox cluster protein n=1 Tax=Halocatena pleomorpha TaxID=1785090 RepID=A0A3P3R8U6_9EURY|nr:DUF6684 family protein [Halocatena pleomorpha]RRJ28963.1 hypothetical protein EIK79_14725 [Halocatena pleomorpha]
MSKYALEWQTILDITVNIIPLVILVFFFVLFAVYDPYLGNPFMLGISLFLLVVPFVLLAFVTYAAGRTLERDEKSAPSQP